MSKKILITSALPYVNNIPHLGNLICIISADVYAKFLRSQGKEVLSVLGTDEHGTTTETRAKQEGISPRELVDKYYAIHKKIYEWFNTDFDCFGRTSDEENKRISSEIFLQLHQNGYIIEQQTTQMWDEKEQTFLADRFIAGTCPHCGFEDAKGDQCDNCGKLLSPEELIHPRSLLSDSTPVAKQTTHLYIDLPKMKPLLEKWMQTVQDSWSHNALTTTQAWLKEGLKPRAITRDINWGIPVPLDEFKHKVLYSWFDAPIGYISITAGSKPEEWQDWWKNPKNTQLVQFMGKDNIPFHTILFPAFLLGTKQDYTLVESLSVNEYINYESGKFSKSRGVGIFGDDCIQTGIPADVWRYYLMNNRPEKEDTVFDWDDFQEKINKELLANFGNLVNRTLSFTNRFFESKTPELTHHDLDCSKDFEDVTQLFESIELRKALKKIMAISKKGNQYFQDQQPWVAVKEGKADNAIANLLGLVKDLAILVHPFMPQVSSQILDQLQLSSLRWDALGKPLPEGHSINQAQPLFVKLEEKDKQKFRKQFGKQKEDKQKNKHKKPSKSKLTRTITFSDLDLRVGKITAVKKHPSADKLFVEQVDVGDRQIQLVSGLVGHYSEEELLGKQVIVLANLAPVKLRGELSQGMLLAVGDKEVGVLVAQDVAVGSPVTFEGVESNPVEKISIDEFFSLQLDAQGGHVFADGKRMVVDSQPITVDKNIDGKVC